MGRHGLNEEKENIRLVQPQRDRMTAVRVERACAISPTDSPTDSPTHR